MRVVLFSFWGRRACVRTQLPLLRRILRDNPDWIFEGWNLARNPLDAEYLRSLADEFTIREDFYQHHDGWNAVWRYYAQGSDDTVYIKFDDDVAFMETDRIAELVKAAREHPGSIISAQVVNNGAAMLTLPGVCDEFIKLGIPVLDVHLSNRFAELSHEYFFENWRNIVDQNVELIPSETWLSINFVALDHRALRYVSELVGKPSPAQIADRSWGPGSVCGDEGAANLLDRYVLQGVSVGHISFGPQELTAEQWGHFLTMYESIGSQYLNRGA